MERPFKKVRAPNMHDSYRELTNAHHQVIIVGAGPAGLLLALMLSQRGIPVHLLEAEDKLDGQPRAAHYIAPALPDLDRAGVLAEVKKRGIIITDFNYRYAVPVGSAEESQPGTGFTRLAVMDGNAIRDVDGFDYRSHCLPLQDLCSLMLELFVDRHGGQVSWRHRVLRAGQEENGTKAWVDVETPEGEKRIEGDYVVGCDGAGSQVRRSLFGSEFPGFTWEKQIVATNTYYDFAKYGFGDVTINVHPDNYYVRTLGVTTFLEPWWLEN
ncbi:FAD binding domain-containing protein [Magnaporthiopsis poae ATCC 64411]|uniref:FAD binding domain-containing protein n=1 Tax=Magnaporthiopsis poae (strain ATCC 64411 / 73-15) TaxID=644358 RepID=A0A0C4EA48_MAGP6|nr:FAD binding domain-containing protein [Magnaporthiopsis poae ATCC 64411]